MRLVGVLADEPWNLLAREMIIILANPGHEALQAAGLHLGFTPWDIGSINLEISCLRGVITWAREDGLPEDPSRWSESDLRRRIKALKREVKPRTLTRHVSFVQRMATLSPALSCGWPGVNPWPGKPPGQVAKDVRDGTLSTKAIPPDMWFALVRAAWTYIHVFAPDIFRALDMLKELRRAARLSADVRDKNGELDAWLADPANKVPCHHDPHTAEGQQPEVYWVMLTLLLGVKEKQSSSFFGTYCMAGRQRREGPAGGGRRPVRLRPARGTDAGHPPGRQPRPLAPRFRPLRAVPPAHDPARCRLRAGGRLVDDAKF